MTTETARRLPIRTIFSGPAGGVSQACHVGAVTGTRNFITYDMGGTSTDVCLVRDLTPVMTSDSMVGAFPVKVPQIDMHTVGAGGGSIAWLEVDGSLQVGPRSAGASPGPAAYGLGGTEPTVTDANVVLGRIAGTPAARRQHHASIPARRARRWRRSAARMGGLGVEALAEGIVKIAVARMTSAIREISIQRGHDPRDFTLIAFGGAGPMHAVALAEEIGITRVLVPRHPGNFSALGLLASDIKHDDVRTRVGPLARAGAAARGAVRARWRPRRARQLELRGLRPRGAAPAPLARPALSRPGLRAEHRGRAPGSARRAAPRRRRGRLPPRAPERLRPRKPRGDHRDGQCAAHRLRPRGQARGGPLPERRPPRSTTRSSSGARSGSTARRVDCPVWERERLPERARLAGPAIVEEFGATTVLPPGWAGEVDEHGNLMLEREDAA